MHEPHHAFDSTKNQLVVSISSPLAHHPSNFSHAFDSTENQLVVSISPPFAHNTSNFFHVYPLCSLSVSSTESNAC
jgi:hypothetical protein